MKNDSQYFDDIFPFAHIYIIDCKCIRHKLIRINMESQKEFSYLDEFKIIKTLGSGYNAVYVILSMLESSSLKIQRDSLWPSRDTRLKHLTFKPSLTNLPS